MSASSDLQAAVSLPPGFAAPAKDAGAAGLGVSLCVSRGETLFFAGDRAEHYFEVVHGTIRTCRYGSEGQRLIFRFAREGEMVGISGERVCAYSAEAATDSIVIKRRRTDVDRDMAGDNGFRQRIMGALREEISAARIQAASLASAGATPKLVSFLLVLAGDDADGGWTDISVSRNDIADHLGMTVETISRKLQELKALGLIRMETANRYSIVDRAAMQALASGI